MQVAAKGAGSTHFAVMPENREIYKTLDLALRVGEVLLSSGAGAADVTATMWSVVHACGLRGVDIDVTFTVLSSRRSSPRGTGCPAGRPPSATA